MKTIMRKRITAISLVAVMLIASIITACVFISPLSEKYDKADTPTSNLNYNSDAGKNYGMGQIGAYNADNSRVALIDFDGDASHYVAIWYPTKISMDLSESLQDVGYYFYYTGRFHNGNPDFFTSGSFGKVLMYHTTLGFYGKSSLNSFTAYGEDSNIIVELRKDSTSNAMAMVDTFNASGNSYGLRDESRNAGDTEDGGDWIPNETDYFRNGFVSSAKPAWDYGYTMMMQGKATKTTSGSVKFKPASNDKMPYVLAQNGSKKGFSSSLSYSTDNMPKASTFKTEGFTNIDGRISDGNFLIDGTRVGNPGTDATDDNFTGTFTIPISTVGLEIDINIYDKSALYSAKEDLLKAYNDLNDRVTFTNIEEYNDLMARANAMLKSREKTEEGVEVNQSNIDTLATELSNFRLKIGSPKSSIPNRVYGEKESYGPADFWDGYHESYFDATPKSGNTVLNSWNDIYDVSNRYIIQFTIKDEKSSVIEWEDATPKTVRLQITPADMIVNTPQLSAVTKPYTGAMQDFALDPGAYVTLKGRMAGTQATAAQVYMSTQEGVFPSSPSAVSFEEVGKYTVYYKVSAANHNDAMGSFEVEVSKADVTVTFDAIQRHFGDSVLSSDAIAATLKEINGNGLFDGMSLDTARAEVAKYFTFAPVNSTNEVLSGILTSVGNYTVNIGAKTFNDGESERPWSDRINLTVANNGDIASNEGAYVIAPKAITVDWDDPSDSGKIYYDGHVGHRPKATLDTAQLVAGDTDNINVTVGIEGKGILNGQEIELDASGNAVNAATYTAKATLSSANYVISNDSEEFTISARPIEVTILDRTRTYGAVYSDNSKGAAAIRRYYQQLFETQPASVYSVITNVTDGYGAIVAGDSVASVFGVEIIGTTTSTDGASDDFFTAGEHTLSMTVPDVLNTNYDIVKHQNGKFTVNAAPIDITLQQFNARYKGAEQTFALSDSNITGISGYEAEHRDTEVKVEYSKDGISWGVDPVGFKDVGTHTLYVRVTAANHVNVQSKTLSVIIDIAHVHFDLTANKSASTYGDGVPSSAEIVERLSVQTVFDKEEDRFEVLNYIEFYLIDGEGLSLTAGNADAGDYTVRARIKDGVDDSIENYNINYNESCNVNAYGIAPKALRVDWTQSEEGWDGDNFTYNAANPTVQPKANAEDVVAGDTIVLAPITLSGSNVGDYQVATSGLTNPKNQRNYYIAEADLSHTYHIVARNVTIEILSKTATYGSAKDVALGLLVSPGSPAANWKYAEGSKNFIGDHFANYTLETTAHASEGFRNVGNYPIYLQPVAGSESVISNYNVTVVNTLAEGSDTSGVPAGANNTGYGNFEITEATLSVSGRYFDLEWKEGGLTVLLSDIAKRITLKGDQSAAVTVKVGALHNEGESAGADGETWSESDVAISAEGKYFVWIQASAANHGTLEAIIYINALSNYISITVGGNISVEYGESVLDSGALFDALFADGSDIAGAPDASDFATALAWLKNNGTLFVGSGASGDISPLGWNKNIGSYSVYYRLNEGLDYNIRFMPKAGSSAASNIDVYTVVPRKVEIVWGDIDEEYGEHGENSKSHTNITIGNVVTDPDTSAQDNVKLIIGYTDADGGKQGFKDGHVHDVGTYIATVEGVSSDRYTIAGADALSKTFAIAQREITVTVKNRNQLTYGDYDAQTDTVAAYLNTNTNDAAYSLSKTLAAGDVASEVFNLAVDMNGQNGYISADSYSISATALNANYSLTFVNESGQNIADGSGNVAELTVNKAEITFDRVTMNPLTFNGREQTIHPSEMIFTLRGDMAMSSAKVEYSKDGTNWSDGISFKDYGTHKFSVRITADNHEVKTVTDREVKVNKAEIVIDMTATSKTYGDAISGSLSDWLKDKCNIVYLDKNGEVADIEGIADDFEFYVVNIAEGGDQLSGLANPVGFYRVYHKTDLAAMNNYSVSYAKSSDGDTVNAKAYEITKRDTSVIWQIDETADWKDAYNWIYTGKEPALKAYVTVVDTDKADGSTKLQAITFTNSAAANGYAVGNYQAVAQLDADTFAKNYNLLTDNDTYEYNIVQRDVTVVIFDKSAVYGIVEGMPEITSYRGNDWKFEGENFEFPTTGGDKVVLSLEAELTDGYLAAGGDYRIVGRGTDSNYNFIFKGNNSDKDYAKYTVEKAEVDIKKSTLTLNYNGSVQSVNVKDILAGESGSVTVAGAMNWADAIVEYKQADGAYSRELPSVKDVGDSTVITYRVILANHSENKEYTMTVNVTVAKIEIDVKAMSSVYGNKLLTSDEMIDGGYISLGDGTTVDVNIKDLFEFYVDGDAKNAGFYNINYRWKNQSESANYDVKFVNANGDADPQHGAYEITKRTIAVEWNKDALIYDGTLKTQTATAKNLIEGDEALAENIFVFEVNTNTGVNAADDYKAVIVGLSEEASKNYALENDRVEYTFAILPKDVTIKWNDATFTYDGSEHVISAEYVSGAVTEQDAQSISISVSGAQVNAGTHTATAKVEGNSNYKIADELASKTFAIGKKTVEIEWGSETFTYDGNAHTLSASVKADSLVGSDTCTVTTTSFTDAGEHFVTVASLSNDNYTVADGVGKTMTIAKAANDFNGTVSVPTTVEKGSGLPDFSGNNAISAKFGEVTVKYYRDEALTDEYTGDTSKAPAGMYYVVVSVEGNDNYDGLNQVFTVEVKGGANVGLILGILIPVILIAAGAVVAIVLVKKKKGAKA